MTSEFISSLEDFKPIIDRINSGQFLGKHIDKGWDSHVYLSTDDGWAVKLFSSKHWNTENRDTLSRLSNYKKITDRANALVRQERWEIPVPGKSNIPIEVIPIEFVYHSKFYNQIVGLSSFIPGANLSKFNPYFLNDYCFAAFSVLAQLENLSERLNQKLSTKGIKIAERNIKLLDQNGQKRLVITDLCTKITDLRSL